MLAAIAQVIRFELKRSVTSTRLAIWFGFALFPAVLIGMLRWGTRGEAPDEALALITYLLVPQASCMLGLLLWATPAVGTELESQSWVYLSMRNQGRIALTLGKYVVAVIWTASYGLLSSILVSILCGVDDILTLVSTLCVLVGFSSCCYAALYMLIGAAFYRRATVAAVVYSFVLEGAVSWIPATINQATVSFRLRSLLSKWTVFGNVREELGDDGEFFRAVLGEQATGTHIGILFLYASVLLLLTVLVVQFREYPVQSDS